MADNNTPSNNPDLKTASRPATAAGASAGVNAAAATAAATASTPKGPQGSQGEGKGARAEAGIDGDEQSLAMENEVAMEEEVPADGISGMFGGVAAAAGGVGNLAMGAGALGLAALAGGSGGSDSGGDAGTTMGGGPTGQDGLATQELSEEEKTAAKKEETQAADKKTTEDTETGAEASGPLSEQAATFNEAAPVEMIPMGGEALESAIMSGAGQLDGMMPAQAGGGLPSPASAEPSLSSLTVNTTDGASVVLDITEQTLSLSGTGTPLDQTLGMPSGGDNSSGIGLPASLTDSLPAGLPDGLTAGLPAGLPDGLPAIGDLSLPGSGGLATLGDISPEGGQLGGILGAVLPESGAAGAGSGSNTVEQSGGDITLNAPAGISSVADLGGDAASIVPTTPLI